MTDTNTQVDEYFRNARNWPTELAMLREMILACPLREELKWRSPCYTSGGKNVAILRELNDCCTLSFFKGALLEDPAGILELPGKNTRAARVIRFTSGEQIAMLETTLNEYLHAAIKVEQEGRRVPQVDASQLEIPTELQEQFDRHPALQTAFQALTPGRRRGYVLYFAAAKQSKTRTARIEKYASQILAGKGIHDCTCGLTKKPPGCDGSHKFAK